MTYPPLFLGSSRKGIAVSPNDELFGVRPGSPRSGEVIATAQEVGRYDMFTEVARRFFTEFLELKVLMEQGDLITPQEQTRLRKSMEKDVQKWQRANEELKLSARNLAADNKMLAAEVENLQSENEKLRLELNEAIMRLEELRQRHRIPRDEPGKYPLTQHMSERAFQEWQRIMKTLPYGGNKEDD